MAKSIALASDASLLASLLLSYIPAVCAFVAARQPGASTAIIDRLSHSRALSSVLRSIGVVLMPPTSAARRRHERGASVRPGPRLRPPSGECRVHHSARAELPHPWLGKRRARAVGGARCTARSIHPRRGSRAAVAPPR